MFVFKEQLPNELNYLAPVMEALREFVNLLQVCFPSEVQVKLKYSPLTGKATATGSAVSEKVRTRLEELDDLEEVRKVFVQLCCCLKSEISW